MQQNYELQLKLLQYMTHTHIFASDSGLLTKHSKITLEYHHYNFYYHNITIIHGSNET